MPGRGKCAQATKPKPGEQATVDRKTSRWGLVQRLEVWYALGVGGEPADANTTRKTERSVPPAHARRRPRSAFVQVAGAVSDSRQAQPLRKTIKRAMVWFLPPMPLALKPEGGYVVCPRRVISAGVFLREVYARGNKSRETRAKESHAAVGSSGRKQRAEARASRAERSEECPWVCSTATLAT